MYFLFALKKEQQAHMWTYTQNGIEKCWIAIFIYLHVAYGHTSEPIFEYSLQTIHDLNGLALNNNKIHKKKQRK